MHKLISKNSDRFSPQGHHFQSCILNIKQRLGIAMVRRIYQSKSNHISAGQSNW